MGNTWKKIDKQLILGDLSNIMRDSQIVSGLKKIELLFHRFISNSSNRSPIASFLYDYDLQEMLQ